MRNGYLLKDIQERFNLKRAWFVNAWRIVGEDRKDLVQPWMNSKAEAQRVAEQAGINLIGELK